MTTGLTSLGERRRTRTVLYLVGVLPSLLLLLLTARIVLVLQHDARGLSAYEAARFADAAEQFADNRFLNPIQRWIPPFDEGGARFRLEDYDGAVVAFEAALELAPDDRECAVRVNLALSHEALGDAARDEGDGQAARDAWEDGRAALGGCVELEPEPSTGEQERRALAAAVQVDDRLVRKLGGDEPQDPRRREEAPPEDAETRVKEREIEERTKRANADNVRHQDEFDLDPEPSSPPPPVPQW